MYHREYNQEIGLSNGQKIVPLRYVMPLFALIAVVTWLGGSQLSAMRVAQQIAYQDALKAQADALQLEQVNRDMRISMQSVR